MLRVCHQVGNLEEQRSLLHLDCIEAARAAFDGDGRRPGLAVALLGRAVGHCLERSPLAERVGETGAGRSCRERRNAAVDREGSALRRVECFVGY